MTGKEKEVIGEDDKKEHPSKSESLNRKDPKLEKNKTIDILNNIKSFSSLKKFTICSVFFSIILLFLPWTGEISPIELVEMKDNLFDTIDIDDVPLRLDLSFYFGYITTSFLIFTIFTIYKSNYRFASLLYLFNLVVLFLIITFNLLYFANGEYRNWIEDEASIKKLPKEERRHSKHLNKKQIKVIYLNFVEEELEEMYDDYDIKDYKLKNRTFSALSWYPILFILLFLTNWILISILSRRKRLEIPR